VSYIFEHLDLIEKALKQPPFGLITDVDGTISHTAPTPQQAEVTPLCGRYPSTLCNHLALVAASSGRPAIEVKNMINIDGMVYIGNHGLERWTEGHHEFAKAARGYSKKIEAALKELSPLLSIEGISIENKGVTATIHYRQCSDPKAAERDILTALENSTQAKSLRIVPGKMSINLLPSEALSKGTTTLDLIREYNLRGGIFLGDDITDIDAFRTVRAASRNSNFQGFAIGVTSREMPENLVAEADFTLNGVNDVERFLKWMSQSALEVG